MKRPESWAEARRPTEAEKRRAKQLLARPGFLPKSAKRGTKVTVGADRGPGAAAPPRSAVERYADVFESRTEERKRATCEMCELGDEAHLHGATLYEAGRALF